MRRVLGSDRARASAAWTEGRPRASLVPRRLRSGRRACKRRGMRCLQPRASLPRRSCSRKDVSDRTAYVNASQAFAEASHLSVPCRCERERCHCDLRRSPSATTTRSAAQVAALAARACLGAPDRGPRGVEGALPRNAVASHPAEGARAGQGRGGGGRGSRSRRHAQQDRRCGDGGRRRYPDADRARPARRLSWSADPRRRGARRRSPPRADPQRVGLQFSGRASASHGGAPARRCGRASGPRRAAVSPRASASSSARAKSMRARATRGGRGAGPPVLRGVLSERVLGSWQGGCEGCVVVDEDCLVLDDSSCEGQACLLCCGPPRRRRQRQRPSPRFATSLPQSRSTCWPRRRPHPGRAQPSETHSLVEPRRAIRARQRRSRRALKAPRRPSGEWWMQRATRTQAARSRPAASRKNVVVEVDGLGPARCYGSPRSDEECVTPETSEDRVREFSAGVPERMIVWRTSISSPTARWGASAGQSQQAAAFRTKGCWVLFLGAGPAPA